MGPISVVSRVLVVAVRGRWWNCLWSSVVGVTVEVVVVALVVVVVLSAVVVMVGVLTVAAAVSAQPMFSVILFLQV